jgi:multiple sugar transport system permease protein
MSLAAPIDVMAAAERRFALALLAPAFVLLLLITTAPLVYLAVEQPAAAGHEHALAVRLRGPGQLRQKMGGDPRFWNSLALTAVYTASTVVLQVLMGLSLALLVLQIPRGQALLRMAAILPIVLAPVVVGLFWRTLVLAPDFGLVDVVTRALGLGSHNWLGDPQLALISVIAIHTWQWTPFAFLVLLATLATLPPDVYEAARLDRAGAWQRFWHITLPLIRPAVVMVVILRTMTALSAFAAIFAATGGGPGTATEILNLYAYRTSFTELNLGYGSALAMVLLAHHRAHFAGCCSAAERPGHETPGPRPRRAGARLALAAVAGLLVSVWAFPVLWALLTSFKSERDVLAYPPVWWFKPTLEHYREVLFGASSILPNLWSSVVVASVTTAGTMLLALPAAYAIARLRYPGRRASGFYVLATQMLPPVGLVIPTTWRCKRPVRWTPMAAWC